MSEFLRIFSDKKRILFLLGLLLLNAIFILKDNYSMLERSKAIEEAISEYQKMDIEEAYERCQDTMQGFYSELGNLAMESEEYEEALYSALLHEGIISNIEYVLGYATKYDGMVTNAGRMISSGLVGGKDTFAYKNIRSTLIDFADIEDLQLSLVNDRTVNAFLDFEMTDYMIILAILLIVASFAEEQKKGLFFIVRSCSGRNRLVFTRQIVLLLSSFLVSLIFYGSTYTIFGAIHGFEELDTLVQCFLAFEDCYSIMSLGSFLILMVLLKTVVIYMIGNLFWIMLNIFNNMLSSLGVISVLLVLEYMAYNTTTEGNIHEILKYLNIFNYISIEDTYTNYLNLNVFGSCVEILPFSVATLIFVTVVMTGIATVVAIKKRYNPAKSIKLIDTIRGKLSFGVLGKHTSLICHEAYRFLRCNGAFVILAVFGIFMAMTYEKARPEYDIVQVYINEHYAAIEGRLDENTDAYLAQQRQQLDADWAELEAYAEEHPEYRESDSYRYAEEGLRMRQEALEFMESENVRLKQLKAEGHDVCFVNFMGYRNIFNVSSISTYVSYLIPIFFVVLCGATVFSYDNEYNFGRFLKATPRGRKQVFRYRVSFVMICTVAIWAVMNIIELYKAESTYGLHQLGTEVSSLYIFTGARSSMSILTALSVMYAIRLLVLVCVALVAMFISSVIQSNKLAYVINLVVLILPVTFVVVGAELFGWVSFVDVYKAHGNVTDIIMGSYAAIVPYVICICMGAVSYVRLRKKMY